MRRALAVGLVQAVWAAGLVAGSGSAAPAAAQENPFTTTVDVRMGERLFRAQCGRCHGRDGIDGTAMIGISPRASDQTVWQIISYVNSLNLDPEDYDLPGDVGAGRQVYNGKGNCANCHMVGGVGGRLGPDLSTVANRRDPDELRSDLLAPNEEVAPRWWTIRVTRADGSVVEGLRMNEDTFTVRIMDADESLWHFMKSQVRSTERITTSTMPGYDDLTSTEVDDLIAYLFSLRRDS